MAKVKKIRFLGYLIFSPFLIFGKILMLFEQIGSFRTVFFFKFFFRLKVISDFRAKKIFASAKALRRS